MEFFDISTSSTLGGTSGIIIDKVSAIAEGSSIYFTTQANSANCGTHRCGVKLTQGGLQ